MHQKPGLNLKQAGLGCRAWGLSTRKGEKNLNLNLDGEPSQISSYQIQMRIGKWLSRLIEYTVGPGSEEELVRICEVGNLQNKGTNTPKTRVETGLMISTSSRTQKGENFNLPMDSLAGWGLRAAENHWKPDLILSNTDENRQISWY